MLYYVSTQVWNTQLVYVRYFEIPRKKPKQHHKQQQQQQQQEYISKKI